jgi:hypothetical protein
MPKDALSREKENSISDLRSVPSRVSRGAGITEPGMSECFGGSRSFSSEEIRYARAFGDDCRYQISASCASLLARRDLRETWQGNESPLTKAFPYKSWILVVITNASHVVSCRV